SSRGNRPAMQAWLQSTACLHPTPEAWHGPPPHTAGGFSPGVAHEKRGPAGTGWLPRQSRRRHPDQGLLYPGDFIAVAEDSGLMLDLGEFVLDTALQEFAALRAQGLAPGKLALNFSFREIEQPDFVGWLLARLAEYGVPGSEFELEITESALINDSLKTVAIL